MQMLRALPWPDEIRPTNLEGLDKEAKVRPQDLKIAVSLIETMAADSKPAKYEDENQNKLKEFIDAKAATGKVFMVQEKDPSGGDDGRGGRPVSGAPREEAGPGEGEVETDSGDKVSDSMRQSAARECSGSAGKQAPLKKASASKPPDARSAKPPSSQKLRDKGPLAGHVDRYATFIRRRNRQTLSC
ncbi:hypothetical protein [Dietzia cercidiphylli]|uniref:hypothetical protein n=1 Tax=Dietzia cercidiphylli TaxID=498199 RepID=UPI0015FD5092|nr:hypothetical protein [Dietzia cercidiphylli]MBB1049071.1 hypothetical protein [Dietzia cercidiphylli]